jgi:outer membrane protein assembly factor BamB
MESTHRQPQRLRIILIVMLISALLLTIGCKSEDLPVASPSTAATPKPTLAPTATPLQLLTVDGQVTLSSLAPIFAGEADTTSIPLEASHYGKAGDTFKVSEQRGEWIAFTTDEVGLIRLPIWYGTDAAKEIRVSQPVKLNVEPGAKYSLFPGSTLTTDGSHLGESIYSAIRWNDWYGILQSPVIPYGEYQPNRPVLLWIPSAQIESSEGVQGGILDANSSLPITEAISIIEAVISKGTDAEAVRQLLGEPNIIETSRNMSTTDEAMRLGVTWRYELGEVHFTITFNKEKKVEEWRLIQTATLAEHKKLSSYTHPAEYMHEYRELPPSPTKAVNWTWRNEYNLGYTYLQAVTNRILLLKGDDGGYSGMHNNGGLYAVDRETGETLWRIDAGFGGFAAYLDNNNEYATVFIDYDPASQQYVQRISRVRLSDGKPVWTFDGSKLEDFRVARAKNTVVIHQGSSVPNAEGKIIALDAATGKERWTKSTNDSYEIINDSDRYAAIMIVQYNTLQAFDPLTGELMWEEASQGTQAEPASYYSRPFIESPINPFEPEKTDQWIMLGNEILLVNTSTKKKQVKARYTIRDHEFVHALEGQYLLIQQPADDKTEVEPTQYKSALYDAVNGKTLWSIPGKAAGAVFDGDVVYMTVDGIPTAVSQADGKMLWKTKESSFTGSVSYYGANKFIVLDNKLLLSYGEDLLLLDKQTGKQLNRLQDVILGYPDLRLKDILNGLINRNGDEMYIGSSNGYFSRMKLDF